MSMTYFLSIFLLLTLILVFDVAVGMFQPGSKEFEKLLEDHPMRIKSIPAYREIDPEHPLLMMLKDFRIVLAPSCLVVSERSLTQNESNTLQRLLEEEINRYANRTEVIYKNAFANSTKHFEKWHRHLYNPNNDEHEYDAEIVREFALPNMSPTSVTVDEVNSEVFIQRFSYSVSFQYLFHDFGFTKDHVYLNSSSDVFKQTFITSMQKLYSHNIFNSLLVMSFHKEICEDTFSRRLVEMNAGRKEFMNSFIAGPGNSVNYRSLLCRNSCNKSPTMIKEYTPVCSVERLDIDIVVMINLYPFYYQTLFSEELKVAKDREEEFNERRKTLTNLHQQWQKIRSKLLETDNDNRRKMDVIPVYAAICKCPPGYIDPFDTYKDDNSMRVGRYCYQSDAEAHGINFGLSVTWRKLVYTVIAACAAGLVIYQCSNNTKQTRLQRKQAMIEMHRQLVEEYGKEILFDVDRLTRLY